MRYVTPRVTDFGSIAEHTFDNSEGIVPGTGPSGKDWFDCGTYDKFDELSCGAHS